MIVERVLEALVLVLTVRAGAAVLGMPWGDGRGAELRRDLRGRDVPWVAVVLTGLLAAGWMLGLVWDGALHVLGRSGAGGSGWQVFTAPFVQTSVLGGAYNVLTALIVLALAEWAWGSVGALVIWLVGAWAPVGVVAELVGYHVSHSDQTAYSAGSSGATFFTAATLSAVVVFTRAGRIRLLGLLTPAVAAAMWALTNDGHAVMVLAGLVFGAALLVVCYLTRRTQMLRSPCDSVMAQSR